MCEPIPQPRSAWHDTDLHHDRILWMKIDTILEMVEREVAERPMQRSPGGLLSLSGLHAPSPCPLENLVGALFLGANEALLDFPRHFERILPSDPTIDQLLQACSAATEMTKESARRYLRFLYSAILTWVAYRETIKCSVQQSPLTPLPKWRFARVRQYIDLHIEEPIRLLDLAKAAGLSRMHFAAQFRAYTGISPSAFVRTRRIQRAKELLGDPRRTLADVALSVGFRTQAHFTTVFHRFVGDTPNCWRKSLCRENTKMIQ